MNILIVFYSYSGNTKKVAEMIKEKLTDQEVVLRNALTVKDGEIKDADVLIIGSPIHGYVLFGQKLCKEVRKVLDEKLPTDLARKKVILYATYLFSPRKVLEKSGKKIEAKNGEILGLVSEKRDKKEKLVQKIVQTITG